MADRTPLTALQKQANLLYTPQPGDSFEVITKKAFDCGLTLRDLEWIDAWEDENEFSILAEAFSAGCVTRYESEGY